MQKNVAHAKDAISAPVYLCREATPPRTFARTTAVADLLVTEYTSIWREDHWLLDVKMANRMNLHRRGRPAVRAFSESVLFAPFVLYVGVLCDCDCCGLRLRVTGSHQGRVRDYVCTPAQQGVSSIPPYLIITERDKITFAAGRAGWSYPYAWNVVQNSAVCYITNGRDSNFQSSSSWSTLGHPGRYRCSTVCVAGTTNISWCVAGYRLTWCDCEAQLQGLNEVSRT